jgi:hypothetical protein
MARPRGCMYYGSCCIIQSGSGSQTAPCPHATSNGIRNPTRPADLMYINLRAGVRGCIIEYECKRVAPPPSWARRRRRCPTRRARDTHAEWCLWPTCQYCWCHDRIIKHAHYHDTHSQHTHTHESFYNMRALAPTVCDSVRFVIVSVNVFYTCARVDYYIARKGRRGGFCSSRREKELLLYFWILHFSLGGKLHCALAFSFALLTYG